MNNPILAFSARRRMRSVRTPLLITIYAFVLSLIGYFTIYACFLRPAFTLRNMQQTLYGYMAILTLQFVLLVLVAPAMTAGSVSGERERQTLDLLLVTNMGAGRLVLGKLLESFGFLALLALSSMPVLSLAIVTGAAGLGQVLAGVAFLLLTALLALCIGMFCSTLFKRTITATVVSYLAVFGVGVLTLLPLIHDVKQISAMYDAMSYPGAAVTQIDYIPVAFVLNPALGLMALLQTQTGNIGNTMFQFSYTMGNTVSYMRYDLMYQYNMAVMAAASAVLTALSALKMRMYRGGGMKGKRHA